MIKNKIRILREKFKKLEIDGYIVPKNDEYFSEYAQNDRLKNITNFSGSAGIAVILKKSNYLFIDGRYTLQAQKECSKNFKIIEIHKKKPNSIIKNYNLGYDPKLFTSKNLNNYFSNNKLVSINENLIDQIFSYKEKKTKPFYSLEKKIVGETQQTKILKVVHFLKSNKADYLFISAPENVAWLLNIRGYDNPNSPIPNTRVIIGKDKKFFLITKKQNINKKIKEKKINKNKVEAHKKDGLALTKFIYWIKNINKKIITEVDAQNKLEKFRKLNNDYLFPSFDTIAGSGSNGAIVHYRATKQATKKITKKDIFLCDSGGQYRYGTTDVTRTICFSDQKQSIKNAYTNVLKGHIAVALTDLNKDNTGKKIDIRARKFLKKDGLDYAHGTGHGVGFFLNVHEGPQSISTNNSIKIEKGMILSNEPGYYKKNKFGIRIENLVYTKQKGKKLFFENLTLAPIENELINYALLNKIEKNYLFKYHLKIYSQYSSSLNKNERKWLATLI